jgi:hypothetical protein
MTNESGGTEKRQVAVFWEALEDAFENNAPEVHSYLQLTTGEVIRIVDGIADPAMHSRIVVDSNYVRIDPVSSREQYRWMERYIATVEEPEFRQKLIGAIDGKGAFRRFKDVLMNYAAEREQWFVFRSERLRTAMEAWLEAHGLEAWAPPAWSASSTEIDAPTDASSAGDVASPAPEIDERRDRAEARRARLRELVDGLPARDLDTAVVFMEFLRERRQALRARREALASGTADDAERE